MVVVQKGLRLELGSPTSLDPESVLLVVTSEQIRVPGEYLI